MAQFPALPLWTDAYLGDTHHLTTIEHGAYLLLLITMWRTREKRLPDNPQLLARYARLTMRQWRRISANVMPFFDLADGYLTQGRLTDEATLVRRKCNSQSAKARARWLKTKASHDAAAMPRQYPHTHTHGTTEEANASSLFSSLATTLRGEVVSEERPSGQDGHRVSFEDFWKQYPHKVGKRAAIKAFEAARKRGVAMGLVMAGLLRYAAKTDDRPWCNPATWLNQDRWLDQPATNGGTHGRPKTLAEKGRELVEQLQAADRDRGDATGDPALWSVPNSLARR